MLRVNQGLGLAGAPQGEIAPNLRAGDTPPGFLRLLDKGRPGRRMHSEPRGSKVIYLVVGNQPPCYLLTCRIPMLE